MRIRQQLRRQIDESFNKEELRTLCFDLEINYDGLPGEGTTSKVREIVSYMERVGRLAELVQLCSERRPHLEWPDVAAGSDGSSVSGDAISSPANRQSEPSVGHTDEESDWIEIPGGEFWMGSERGRDNEKPLHRVQLQSFKIARVPITNDQYYQFVTATGHRHPPHWPNKNFPTGLGTHPVIYINASDASAYCNWLSNELNKTIGLPTEAEWEKAARGDQDQRAYPWGDLFDPTKSNTAVTDPDTTTPVGSYPTGASPYGVLDMCGNMWEWTASLIRPYPYQANDGREVLDNSAFVLRGGAYYSSPFRTRCSYRSWDLPHVRKKDYGFRIVLRS